MMKCEDKKRETKFRGGGGGGGGGEREYIYQVIHHQFARGTLSQC